MNHTTLGIVAVLAAAALVAGIFATGVQAAFAGGYKGGGDSVSFKQSIKQKAKCEAIVIEPVNCNNIGVNLFANAGL